MKYAVYSTAQLWAFKSIVDQAKNDGITISELSINLSKQIENRAANLGIVPMRMRDIKCKVCGGSTIILPVNKSRGTVVDGPYTHVLLCLNKPRFNEKWGNGHCGHSEFIIIGETNG